MAEVMHPIRRTVWLIYHVPKTGGQTLRYHLRQELGSEGHAHLGRFEPHLPLFTTDDLAGPAADDVRVVTGHPVSRATGRLFPEARILDVLVLRDPLARVVSHWMFQTELRRRKGRPPRSFVEFASRLGPNPMTATWRASSARHALTEPSITPSTALAASPSSGPSIAWTS